MNAPVFDGIARDMGEASSRRTFVRLVGGVAAMGAIAAVSRDDMASLERNSGNGPRNRASEGVTRCESD